MNQERGIDNRILRVGAYCRVSTDRDDQANSFESQKRYFTEYINRNAEWELAEIFADEGKSGTSTKKRREFNRMIECARAGELDLIITKEISRFARNTLDSIYYTRELKRLGVGVIFLNDNINTLEPDAELRLTIMSSIAQEESRKTSDRVKWGQKRRMEQGVVFGRDMLGYDVKGGVMTINEDGAAVVRLIFDKFVNENKGTSVIARELREAGIKTSAGITQWSNTVILRAIRNEKYCGDLIQKKTYTPDYLSHDKKYNRGQEEFVILRDHHEPIVSRETFDRAGAILESRALSQEGKAKHSNRYAFSGRIKCGICGQSYVARYKTRKDGSQYKAWRCFSAQKHGAPHVDKAGNQVGCTGESVRDEDAAHIMQLVVSSLRLDKTAVMSNLMSEIQTVVARGTLGIDTDGLAAKLGQIEEKQRRLLDIYMNGEITKDEFIAARERCNAETQEVHDLIESVEKQNLIVREQQELIDTIADALNEMLVERQENDEFYRTILNRMVVQDRDHIDVYLNLLTHKWSYAIEKASICNGLQSDNLMGISDTQMPISVNSPRSSSYGIVNR
jgi:DNA invertase Pin-like site-specific DNA recombinase